MKTRSLIYISILSFAITSCGNKIYSYRRTVKVDSKVTVKKAEKPLYDVYFTFPSNASGKTSVQAKKASINMMQNTVYSTTKPIKEKRDITALSYMQSKSSAMPR